MAKVLFIGDSHLKINRFELAKSFIAWLNPLIEAEKPDLVINLGDFFDTHSVIRSEIMGEFVKHAKHVISLKIPYIYILGNHDQYRPNDATYHALLPLKDVSGLYIVDQVCELFGMTMVPYQPNPTVFPRHTLPICVAHQTVIGADYGTMLSKDGIDLSTVGGCNLFISGHIHKRQYMPGEPAVLYVGSPFAQSVNDVNQVKGITILDTDTYRTTFKRCPLPMWRQLSLEISSECTIEHIHAAIIDAIKASVDHWVFELAGPRAELVGYLGSQQYIEAVRGVDVKLKTKFTDSEKRAISIEAKSMDHIISTYIEKVYSGSIDKSQLITVARTILEQSRSNS
jgi:DNA repair exonuclease SbcCD nuclease subunit